MLWASGGFTLRVSSDGPARDAIVSVTSPFAMIGRTAGAAVILDDPAVSSRHVYLHLDRRGLFAVDLATRTGTRVGPGRGPSGWLRPGDRLEVAGREIELLALRLDDDDPGEPDAPDDRPVNPLDDTGDAPFVRLTLYPDDRPGDPLLLNSELVFVGRSASCAVTIDSLSAARVQCVLVRAARDAYVVDLIGRGTWKNQQPVRGSAPLEDGDSLMVGGSRFDCRIEPPGAGRPGLPAISLGVGTPAPWPTEMLAPAAATPPPLHLIPPEAQAAVLGWLMGQLQSRQDEGSRRQAEFQLELVRLVAEIHRDNHAVLNRHLERADAIHRELSELRDEMKRRFGDAAPGLPALPGPRPLPLNIAPVAPPDDPEAAANWLISRVNQLDQENRKGWKDLLGRLSGRKDE